MTSFNYEVRIPKDRIAVLIGKQGEVKKQLEEATHSKIEVDSQEGDVLVQGDDPLMLFSTKNIIRAIARGFNPDIALRLLNVDYVFEIIDIKEFAANPSHIPRLKGRVIGGEGKTRQLIEELTQTNICVYGKTISIIGPADKTSNARRAIESLLAGSPHATVYKWLEKQRKNARMHNYFDQENKDKEDD